MGMETLSELKATEKGLFAAIDEFHDLECKAMKNGMEVSEWENAIYWAQVRRLGTVMTQIKKLEGGGK